MRRILILNPYPGCTRICSNHKPVHFSLLVDASFLHLFCTFCANICHNLYSGYNLYNLYTQLTLTTYTQLKHQVKWPHSNGNCSPSENTSIYFLISLNPRLAGGGALNAPTFFAALYLRNGAPQARQILGTCCALIAVYDSEVSKKSVQKFLRYWSLNGVMTSHFSTKKDICLKNRVKSPV